MEHGKVHLPKNRTVVKCKWIYKVKYQLNIEIERYKAQLVTNGYSQKIYEVCLR